MITKNIAYWRSLMNEGKGISQAHLAREVGVGRSFVTKLEKGIARPGAELMFRVAQYFKQPVQAIFQHRGVEKAQPDILCAEVIPFRQSQEKLLAPAAVQPVRCVVATPPARPAGLETVKDKSLVKPTAKIVASSVALASHRKSK